MTKRIPLCVLSVTVSWLLPAGGCSRPCHVMGKVMLDGAPLANAVIAFTPQEGTAETQIARTDSEGRYDLARNGNPRNARPGRYTVRVTTYREGTPDTVPPVPPVMEKVPAKYNIQSELVVEITDGAAVHDFELTSGVSTLRQIDQNLRKASGFCGRGGFP